MRTLFEAVGPAYVSYDDSKLRTLSTDKCPLCGLWGQTAKALGEKKVTVNLADVEMAVRAVTDVRADATHAEAQAVVNTADVSDPATPRSDGKYKPQLVRGEPGGRVDAVQPLVGRDGPGSPGRAGAPHPRNYGE
ncbi:hypothetical protein [Kibdelosporangium phytohabitans]|uniref:hypothetical protein n=1 Tax=Kibdelosporangium phytohabitans TaxID=860235 RepID=UPI0012F866DA|nr:hypothetical protein [Kibdelosporangium phytohabitans]MBE1468452.1 hypothetical protein [Kibdelosporangium phytohabitans]